MARPTKPKTEAAPTTTTTAPAFPWLKVAQVFLLVAIGLWIYGPVLRGDWLWDDDTLITHNTSLPDLKGLWRIWFDFFNTDYWPVTYTFFWAEWHLWGDASTGYHLVNLALHVVDCCLVWHLLNRLGLRWGWLGALIFLVHPLNVESVAWVSETKNTLSLLLFLLAIESWLDHEEKGGAASYAGSLLFYLAAVLSKSASITLPVVLLLYAWWKNRRLTWRDVTKLAPYFVIALVLGSMASYQQNRNHQSIGADAVPLDPLYIRPVVVGLTTLFYLAKFFVPVDLLPIYPRWILDHPTLLELLSVPFLLGLAALLWIWREKDWSRLLLLGLGFFAITALPTLGLVPMLYSRISRVADHFLYLPMIGLIGLVVAGVEIGLRRTPVAVRCGCLAAIIGVLGVLAWGSKQYAGFFVNQQTLWLYTVARNADAWPAQNDLGLKLLNAGRLDDAATHFEQAIRTRPDYAEAHNNLGLVFLRKGLAMRNSGHIEASVAISPNAGGRTLAASPLSQDADFARAVSEFEQALRIKPHYADARGNLALARTDLTNSSPVDRYEQALKTNPHDVDARNDLGLALLQAGRVNEAAVQFQQVIRERPGYVDAHSNLGLVLLQTGHIPQAITELQEALRLKPDFAEAHNNLGLALSQAGRLPEALTQYQQALALKPDYAAARGNLNLARQILAQKNAPPKK